MLRLSIYSSETIHWNLVGNESLVGREPIIQACQQSADYLSTVTTTFSKFTMLTGTDFVVVDSTADYVDEQKETTRIASCNIYVFIDSKLTGITSYSIDITFHE